ncbi:MAG: transcription antitermination factor NusB [Candidatus Delongbacteria bacterium]
MISRRAARETAVLILYAQQSSGLPLSEVMDRVRILQRKVELDLEVGDALPANELDRDSVYAIFLRNIVLKTIRDTEVIDDIIAQRAHKWDLERIARLDRIILRIGIAEMLHFPDIPEKVSINEAIEIAKKYSTENSGKFVNGILDSVKSDMAELRQKYADEA